jgi:hypothetical protein
MGVDCKFLNFGVNIAKALKLHGLKMNFSQNLNSQERNLANTQQNIKGKLHFTFQSLE